MRHNNKYAMPVDPRVLEKDFETDTTVNLNTFKVYWEIISFKESKPYIS
jgi:hypothetical protein